MNLRAGLIAIDALLLGLLVLRLFVVRRQVLQYRPPSPLPKTRVWDDLTVTRVS